MNRTMPRAAFSNSREQELSILLALARFELECAGACDLSVMRVKNRPARESLMELRNDHLRQVDALNALIAQRKGHPLANRPDPSVLDEPLPSPLDAQPVLQRMLRWEQEGTGAYENALEYAWDLEARAVLHGHIWQQQRHVRLLSCGPLREWAA